MVVFMALVLAASGASQTDRGEPPELVALPSAAATTSADGHLWLEKAHVLQCAGASSEAEAIFQGALRADPADAVSWLNAGAFASGHLGLSEAEFRYRQALDLAPDWYAPHYNLGEVLVERAAFAEAEASYRAALRLDPEDSICLNGFGSVPQPHKSLAMLLLRDGRHSEGEHQLRRAFAALTRNRLSPIHFASNMYGGEEGYQMAVINEHGAFEAEVSLRRAASTQIPGIVDALQTIRYMENSTDWLLQWALDKQHLTSSDVVGSTYGVTWFPAWQKAFAFPELDEKFRYSSTPIVAVMGSALGDQCLFALALGAAHCIGYEVLCDSMVVPARTTMAEYGLSESTDLLCEGAENATGLDKVSVVWVNDLAWPPKLRWAVQVQLVTELTEGTIVVFYDAPLITEALEVVDTLEVEVSWDAQQQLYVTQHVGLQSLLWEL